MRRFAKPLYGLTPVPRVRIPPSPPDSLFPVAYALFHSANRGWPFCRTDVLVSLWCLIPLIGRACLLVVRCAARSFCEQSLSEFRQLGDSWGIASALSDLASLSCDQGNNVEARRLHGESIKVFQELGHKRGIARALECLAVSAAAQSNSEQSLHLAGAAAALRQRLGAPLTPAEQAKLEQALEFARRTLGNAAATAWIEGWAMPVEQAVREDLTATRHPIFRIETLLKSICSAGIDQAPHRRDAIGRKTSTACVFANRFLVRRQVHTIDFIAGDVGVEPFDFRSQFLQHADRLPGDRLQFRIR
jgi:hypothetical protein